MHWRTIKFANALQASKEYSAIIEAVLSGAAGQHKQESARLLEMALAQRASIHEQLEAYDLSLQDFCHLLQLRPNHSLVRTESSVLLMLKHAALCTLYGAGLSSRPF